MGHSFLPRTLWYSENRERIELAHTQLHAKFNIHAQPLIILGDAGMGKTTLLKWLANQHGYLFITAHQLLHPPRRLQDIDANQILVIDALDELTAHSSVEAIERVLDRLGEKGYPPFLLSCRAADWFGAAATRAVESTYEKQPVQLHLRALNDEEIRRFLNDKLPHAVASDLFERLRASWLHNWLGNPYTLELLVESAKAGERPESRKQMFELATRQLLKERNEVKSAGGPSQDSQRHAASAACAAMIISGCEVICRKADTTAELRLVEVQELADADHLLAALSTRLFEAVGVDRFTYAHRSLGEYLAAHWLMRCAYTHRKRRRLLALFHRQGIVPSHLRGLHAWLALDTHLASDVIATDPMGIIEYGDVGQLSEVQASMLLRALRRLATDNPGFLPANHQISLREAIKPGMKTELLAILPDKGMPFQLRLLLLESIQGNPVVNQLETILRSLVVDPKEAFALRRSALQALCAQQTSEQATELLILLRSQGSNDASQLALNLIGLHGYSFPNTTMAECVICCEHHPFRIGDMGMSKYDHVIKHFPTDRMASFLNVLTASVSSPAPFSPDQQRSGLADLVMQLIGRYLKEQMPDINELWGWLHFSALHGSFPIMAEETHQHLRDDSVLRRRLQKLVLLENVGEESLMQREQDLQRASQHLGCSEEDAIVLLDSLNPQDLGDQRWQEIVVLIHHTEDQGVALREAAHAFAAKHGDRLAWLAQLQLFPSNRELSSLTEELEQQHALEQQQKLSALRSTYLVKTESILKGDFTSLIEIAQVYLGSSKAFRFDACDTERLASWLGQDLAQSFLLGFEAYLQQIPHSLSLTEIASFLGQQQWFLPSHDLAEEEGLSPFIIAAALTVRQQDGRGFKDLDEVVLLTGFLAVQYLFKNDPRTLQTDLNSELKSRMLLQKALRLRCEPHILGGYTDNGLGELLYDDDARVFAADLARTWLEQFDSLPTYIERELVRMLLDAEEYDALRSLARTRPPLTKEHSLIWDSVGLVVSFDDTRERLVQKRLNKHLLEEFRELIIGRYGGWDGRTIKLEVPVMAWMIKSFRSLWPLPQCRMGDLDTGSFHNQDMAASLVHLIDALGNLTTPEAVEALDLLCTGRLNSYSGRLLEARANQRRRQYDASYTPATLKDLRAIADDAAPDNEADLKAFVLAELNVVQGKITSDDVDSWRGFYCDNQLEPHGEERCRDWLVSLLREGSSLVAYEPEAHLAADKKADIACFAGTPRICIEVKGQWHQSVWTAADEQLDRLYTPDYRASGIGIYLVLWFGKRGGRNHALKSPGGKVAKPRSPSEMKEMLERRCQAFQQGRVEIVVLDLTHQTAV
ncbi:MULTISPECIES: NACHT domain-containing protein [Enterobacteriaceae]|uniref:NACHT domain-containing protein n=2 Tax=Enterobacterales TaxID=91347 RepID=UPI001BCBE32B|nr:hypothetical protein [Cedecea lapagei]